MNELKSYTEYAVSTPTADFVIGFDFNYGEDAVNVTVDDVPASAAGYTVVYLNETTIRLSPSVPSGVVRLQRETDIDQTDHAYRAGAKFIAQTMDENFEQLRHSQQEVRDGFSKLSTDTHEIIEGLDVALELAQDAAQDAQDAALIAQGAADTVNTIIVGGKVGASNVLDASGETQQQVNYNGGSKWHTRTGGYKLNERVVLTNGDIVKSTIDGNTNNPNSARNGWSMDKIRVVSSKAELETTEGFPDQVILMTGYFSGQYQGGDTFKFDQSKMGVNNNVTVINGWVKQFSSNVLTVSSCGARVTDSDHSAALTLATQIATSLKMKLIVDFDLRVSQSTPIDATLNIEGDGGAFQNSRSITVTADIGAFTVREGFSSESSRFANLMFKSSVGGQGTAFRSVNNGYLSMSTLDHLIFDRSLRIGIDANIILCDFQKCDFGSYMTVENTIGFKAIRALGIPNSQEPNANTFYNCLFRKGSDDYMIEYDAYGAQWQFFACTLEQNSCTSAIINATASGSIMFKGGYIEANSTPYFTHHNGSSFVGLVPLVSFEAVHLNNPVTVAIGKTSVSGGFPKYAFRGCYGQMNCALWENESGVLNSPELLSESRDNHIALGVNGSVGKIASSTNPNGLTESKNNVYFNPKEKTLLATISQSGVGTIVSNLYNNDGLTDNYGGVITLFATTSTTLGAGGTISVYELILRKSPSSRLISVVSKIGDTVGDTNGQPAFNFSINTSDQLVATPILVTSDFYTSFSLESKGNLKLRLL